MKAFLLGSLMLVSLSAHAQLTGLTGQKWAIIEGSELGEMVLFTGPKTFIHSARGEAKISTQLDGSTKIIYQFVNPNGSRSRVRLSDNGRSCIVVISHTNEGDLSIVSQDSAPECNLGRLMRAQ